MNENPYAPPRASVADIEPPPPLDQPRSVVIAVQLLWMGFGVGLLGSLVNLWGHSGAHLLPYIFTKLFFKGIDFAISYWLYNAAWRGRGWSRMVMAVLMAAGLAARYFLHLSRPELVQQAPLIGLIGQIATLTEVIGIVLLFTPTAHAWYRAMRVQRQELRD